MTKSQFDSSSLTNLVDADPSALRPYIILGVAILAVLIGGAALYTWHVQTLQDAEQAANDALYNAKNAADKIKVADDFPGTLTAPRALIMAGKDDFEAGDYTGSLTVNQRVLNDYAKTPFAEAAELGEAAAWEETDRPDDALRVYLEIARRRSASPFSPYAYFQAASILKSKNDTDSLRTVLDEALSAAQGLNTVPGSAPQFTQLLVMMRAGIPSAPDPSTTVPTPSAPPSVSAQPNTSINSVHIVVPSQAPVVATPTPISKPKS